MHADFWLNVMEVLFVLLILASIIILLKADSDVMKVYFSHRRAPLTDKEGHKVVNWTQPDEFGNSWISIQTKSGTVRRYKFDDQGVHMKTQIILERRKL